MKRPRKNLDILVGKSEAHLCAEEEGARLGGRVNADVLAPFEELREAARSEGFDLAILSGFRGFERQLSIWNRKATGALAVLDTNARPLDIGALEQRDLAFAILRWSALPGASRHHWGTDIDVYDAAAKPHDYEIELIPAEVNAGGMFAPLHEWLDDRVASGTSFGFFRPYDVDRNGIAPERWHLSYAPLARDYLADLSVDLLRDTIGGADIALKQTILDNLGEIHSRFITNINNDV